MAEDKKYIQTVGRRKTSVARVRLTEASKTSYVINDRELANYFPTTELQRIATEAFATSKTPAKYKVSVQLKGGGMNSQAEAMRHGIARGLIEADKELRGRLKIAGFLKRDPRAKERRKFGLKKARKAPQWSKR
jgi:small subunit ribosomal protein S9